MRPEEIVNARIDALQAGVNPAVQRPDGAQFALMLSMISASQEWAQQLSLQAKSAEPNGGLLDRNQLYTPEIAGDMARSLLEGRPGDLHMWLSWLDTKPLSRMASPELASITDVDTVPLSQAAVLAKRYDLVGEVRQSRVLLAA
ncbi:MAG: hypothetical protein ACI9W6_002835 [Motiliproteus sp.]|jgi:hypothetical protein